MAQRLVVQPESGLDIQAAAVWYEDQRAGLGARFLEELDQVFRRIVDNPRQFPRVEDERINVLAVLHLHRHPEMWKSRN